MKNVTFLFVFSYAFFLFVACDSTDPTPDYPRLYTYDDRDMEAYSEYEVVPNNNLKDLPSSPKYVQFVQESAFSLFDEPELYIEEIEILDEELVRIKIVLEDNNVFDSTFVYSMDGEYIDIAAFTEEFGKYYFQYDDDGDIMYLRYQAYIGRPGDEIEPPFDPNLYGLTITTSHFESTHDHALDLVENLDYQVGDTIITAIPRRIYR